MTRKIKISDTTLSDSSHTLRRMPLSIEELIPLAEAMDVAGFYSAEVWGGSTFDTCLRYLNENPWERLRIFSRKLKNTPMRIIVRGQNLLGYNPLSMDVIKAFAEEIAKNGIKYARIFDPLNDIGNLEHVISTFIAAGVDVEGTIIYSQSPVHSNEGFTEFGSQLLAMGCKSLCVNDVAGMLTPAEARELATSLSKLAPTFFHTRSISGMGALTYTAALEAGAEGIDCTIGPFAVSAAQPTIESMIHSASDLGLDTGLDQRTLRAYSKAAEYVAMKFATDNEDSNLSQNLISIHKIPVGMLVGISSELAAISAQQKLAEVLSEVTRIREDFGWPPLTTPISQLVAAQAIYNVISGKRYELKSREVINYLKGMYGSPPGEINPELFKGIERVSGRASLLMEPMMKKLENELRHEGVFERYEDVITYALFGQTALLYFKKRNDPSYQPQILQSVDNRLELLTSFMKRRGIKRLEISSKDFRIKLVKGFTKQQTQNINSDSEFEDSKDSEKKSIESDFLKLEKIISPLTGTFYRASSPSDPPFVTEGTEVDENTVIGLVEAMKLFHEVKAERKGIIRKFAVENGETAEQNGVLAYMESLP
ncbi:TPA: hypothetical protein DEF17_07610 [bacterium]|nr:hypothetical protein [bacterium]